MNDATSKLQLSEIVSSLAWALKYALAVGFATLLVLGDRLNVPGRMTDEIVWRPDRAFTWALVTLLVLGAVRALVVWGNRAENENLRAAIEVNKSKDIAPIELSTRIGRWMADEEFVAEFQNVGRYEVRRTRAANFAMMSIGKNHGPLRVRAGQFAFDAPEVWRSTGVGTLVVSNRRMIWLGTTRRQEWRWSVVGDVISDRNGLLVFGRSGRPVGLKMHPAPEVFAYIEQQLGV